MNGAAIDGNVFKLNDQGFKKDQLQKKFKFQHEQLRKSQILPVLLQNNSVFKQKKKCITISPEKFQILPISDKIKRCAF